MNKGLTASEKARADELDAHARAGRTLPLVFEAPRRGKPPKHWADLAPDERRPAVTAAGLPGFRASQFDAHYYKQANTDPATWTDLPASLRADVAETFFPPLLREVAVQTADEGTTVKTLWRLHDDNLVESVLMEYGVPGKPSSGTGRHRATLCISSQAGCGMACPFCATGQGGLQRNLSAGEIVAQVVAASARVRLSNVVFMGMGEPMANYPAIMAAVRRMVDDIGMSARGITVSTVGLVPRIEKLATEGLPVTLAVSLHAPDDELRDSLVPINTRFKVGQVVDAAYRYFETTGRRVSIEYALIRDVNDQAWRADALADVLTGSGRGAGWVHVNPIPLNPTPGSKWTASRRRDEQEFVRRLNARGIAATIRDTRGQEIDGACGQLAAKQK
ncbi:MAG: 23S rRNA (adenine(2503)-C(2))-methyltransferase RlmN [Propioniciclava sp.]|uniref:23S rRNA (adenine(2503)-C(2))-methyltransferase RlmN n=1 Tax=Propioniciclava sp. TaxID=2038686 RepID=UPI0039E7234C